MAEMVHLQKLGEMIILLGGSVGFTVKQRDGRSHLWTPRYLTLAERPEQILMAGIESEKAAIRQYEMHIKMIRDNDVNAMLTRIIRDEQYHIMLLQMLAKELGE